MKTHRYLTHEQLARVADAAGGEAARLILIAGYTGPRWGELSALTVADTAPLSGRLTISKAYTRPDSGALILGPTKTRGSSRTVVVPKPLRSLLVALIEGKRRDALVFSGPQGDPLRRETFARPLSVPCAPCRASTGPFSPALLMPDSGRSWRALMARTERT